MTEALSGADGGMDVLVVEDDPAMLELLRIFLEDRGHRVTALMDGESAWNACQAGDFPLIILDWLLPGMDGLELCRRIRGIPQGKHALIMVVTVRTGPGDLEQVLAAGADDYLAKPVDIALLNIRLAIAEKRAGRHLQHRDVAAALARTTDQCRQLKVQTRLKTVLESSQDGFYLIDRRRMRFAHANDAGCRRLGYTLDELLTMGPQAVQPGFTAGELAQIFDRIIDSPEKSGILETDHRRKDGAVFPVEVSLRAIAIDGCWMLTAVARDITERRALQQELEHQARTDYLTALYTRRYFMEQAQQEVHRALRYGSRLSLLMLDIDHFKSINDSHGHQAGDQVLQKLSALCRTALREVDIIGRLGGEEFAILLPETDGEEAREVAERLRQSIADSEVPVESGQSLSFTVSIGLVSLTENDAGIDVLLDLADKELYRAKHEGRNRVCAGIAPSFRMPSEPAAASLAKR